MLYLKKNQNRRHPFKIMNKIKIKINYKLNNLIQLLIFLFPMNTMKMMKTSFSNLMQEVVICQKNLLRKKINKI